MRVEVRVPRQMTIPHWRIVDREFWDRIVFLARLPILDLASHAGPLPPRKATCSFQY